MSEILLKYGRSQIPFEYDENRFEILGNPKSRPVLSDVEINKKLDVPIGSKLLEDIVNPGETVLIVVPDATRQTACDRIVNLLVRRLIANGTSPFEIKIIFATGIHRAVTEAEKQSILSPFIAQRIKTIDHGPRDLMQIASFGETSDGIPVELNRALAEHDRVVLVGGVTFHYFAGFTGGRKLICPGLASSNTISQTHKLAFNCETKYRRDGVGSGLLDGNAVHEAFMEAAAKIDPAFCVSAIVNGAGEAVDIFSGDWISSHRAACDAYAADHTIKIKDRRDLVIASCGGFPHDINMIQAHKALETASHACIEGGTIILLAECSEGLGRADFLNWFESGNSEKLAENLSEKYQVNGQTAWSLLQKAERFNIQIVTALEEDQITQMQMKKPLSFEEALSRSDSASTGYIVTSAGKLIKN